MTLALIDGDIVAYRASVGVQKDIQWGDGAASQTVDVPWAVAAALETTKAWCQLAGASDCIVTFTGKDNWRKRVLSTYKANRAGNVKPQAFRPTVEAMEARFKCRTVRGLEADDIMGILATTETYGDAVVVTVDKDLRTVPGRHLNPLKETKPTLVSELEADARWLMQALMGDPSDGYTGIPGVGVKKAEKILGGPVELLVVQRRTVRDLWPHVVAAYVKAGLTEVDALVQARVARILRRCDYDKATKEILLWHPTTPVRIPLVSFSALNVPTRGAATAVPPSVPPAVTSTSNGDQHE